jgi:hypothetical protein
MTNATPALQKLLRVVLQRILIRQGVKINSFTGNVVYNPFAVTFAALRESALCKAKTHRIPSELR